MFRFDIEASLAYYRIKMSDAELASLLAAADEEKSEKFDVDGIDAQRSRNSLKFDSEAAKLFARRDASRNQRLCIVQ